MIDIHYFYQKMSSGNIVLSFKGHIDAGLLSSILDIMENKLKTISEPSKIQKKVYNVLVECLQNLYHHINESNIFSGKQGKDLDELEKSAIFMIGKEEDAYKIFTGNQILSQDVEDLKNKIDNINGLNRKELKMLYQDILNNGQLSAKGGGGLGLVDIARKSGNKLNYSFEKMNEDLSFFTLEIKVSIN